MTLTAVSPVAPLALEIRPARMDDIPAILALHREAFADKFGVAFGTNGIGRGVEAMAAAWRRQGSSALRGMYVALAEGRLIGTTTLRTWEMGSDDGLAAEIAFQQTLGMWGALRSVFTLSLLDHTISRDEGYITDVAVLAAYRRRGVARALLARAEEDARLRRKRFLSLYVSARNPGARELYLRAGFREVRVRRSLLAALILHQPAWVFMRKPLDG
jgi:ribosomal protein S18 acetylase RimI-like enzyme